MKLELYEWGLLNAIREAGEILKKASETTNKKAKEHYINKVYGMLVAIDALLIEGDDEEENEGE